MLHILEIIPDHEGNHHDYQKTGNKFQPVGGAQRVPQCLFIGVDLHRIRPCGPVDISSVVELVHILPAQLPHGFLIFLLPCIVPVLGLYMDTIAGGTIGVFLKDALFSKNAFDACQPQALLHLFIQPRLHCIDLIPCEGKLLTDRHIHASFLKGRRCSSPSRSISRTTCCRR